MELAIACRTQASVAKRSLASAVDVVEGSGMTDSRRCLSCNFLSPEMGIFALAQTATKFIAGVVMACRWRTVAKKDRLIDHATAFARESAHTGGGRRLQAKKEGLLRRSRHVWQHTTRLWKKLGDAPISMTREYVEA